MPLRNTGGDKTREGGEEALTTSFNVPVQVIYVDALPLKNECDEGIAQWQSEVDPLLLPEVKEEPFIRAFKQEESGGQLSCPGSSTTIAVKQEGRQTTLGPPSMTVSYFKDERDNGSDVWPREMRSLDNRIAPETGPLLLRTSVKEVKAGLPINSRKADIEHRSNPKRAALNSEVHSQSRKTCGKQFKLRSDLQTHLPAHADAKIFVCDICEEQFKSKQTVRRHMSTHTSVTPFACESCSKQFRNESDLLRHMFQHGNIKPFVCDVCNKWCKDEPDLEKHATTHVPTNAMPFSCDMCTKRFRNNVGLWLHLRTHGKPTIFACDVCDKQCTSRSCLIWHKKSHSSSFLPPIPAHTGDLSCGTCNIQFSSKSRLTRHMLTHSDPKPFS